MPTDENPICRAKRRRVLSESYPTIRALAEALVRLVHHKDADGREIGYDYESIRRMIIHKFPFVETHGPHRGKATRMPFDELGKITEELNRSGVRLPFRPRRSTAAAKKDNKS